MCQTKILYNDDNTILLFCEIINSQEILNNLKLKYKTSSFKNPKRIKEYLTTCFILESFFKKQTYYTYNKYNKPVLCNNLYNISISHSKNYVTVLLSKNKIPGIDIEEINPRIHKISEKFLTKNEKKTLTGFKETTKHLFIIWCSKEAIYKCYNKSLDFQENIEILNFDKSINIIEGVVKFNNTTNKLKLNLILTDSYVIVWTLNNNSI